MVGDVVYQRVPHSLSVAVSHLYLYVTASFAEADALVEQGIVRDAVQLPHKRPGVITEVVVAFLELVQLLDDTYRNVDVVVLEIEDGAAVMQDDIGVQDKYLGRPPRVAVSVPKVVLEAFQRLSSHTLPFMNSSIQGVTVSLSLSGYQAQFQGLRQRSG